MTDEKVQTPYTLREIEGTWVAHAVAFDVVATGKTTQQALESLGATLTAYIGWGIRNGRTIRDCYFAAPASYWTAPFLQIEVPWKGVTFATNLPPAAPSCEDATAVVAARKAKSTDYLAGEKAGLEEAAKIAEGLYDKTYWDDPSAGIAAEIRKLGEKA